MDVAALSSSGASAGGKPNPSREHSRRVQDSSTEDDFR